MSFHQQLLQCSLIEPSTAAMSHVKLSVNQKTYLHHMFGSFLVDQQQISKSIDMFSEIDQGGRLNAKFLRRTNQQK